MSDQAINMPQSIRLFIKPYCGWCDEVIDWLEQHGIQHETLDVTSDESARRDMTRLSGQTMAPVIDVDGDILADFGAGELAAWWRDNGWPLD